jgi:hypothetical protein
MYRDTHSQDSKDERPDEGNCMWHDREDRDRLNPSRILTIVRESMQP